VVSVPLVADVVEPADVLAVACEDPIALGGGEEAAEFSLPSETPFGALVAAPLRPGSEG
jgi:hypothetical protein